MACTTNRTAIVAPGRPRLKFATLAINEEVTAAPCDRNMTDNTMTDNTMTESKSLPIVVPTMVPRGAENGDGRPCAVETLQFAQICTDESRDDDQADDADVDVSPKHD